MFSKLIKTTKKSNKEISLLDLTDFVTKLFQFNKTLPILTPNVIEQVQYINDKNIKDVCPILIKYNMNADGISTVVKNIKITYDLLILIFKNEHLKIKIE